MAYRTLTIPLSMEEMETLKRMASGDCRNPRDQARYILRQALQSDHPQATTTPTPQLQAQPAGPIIGR